MPEEIPTWFNVYKEQLKRMDHTLYGNGREGITDKIQRVETLLRAAIIVSAPIGLAASGFIVHYIFEKVMSI